MKLYYSPGTCSLASHIVLREIGKDFDLEKVDTDSQKTETSADYNRINPKGKVPALELNDGQILTEGAAILQYIADQNPEAELAPKYATVDRAQLQEHLNCVASELHKAFGPLFNPNSSDDDKSKARINVEITMDHFESIFSDGRKYLVNNTFSVADAYLFVVSGWTVPTGIGLDKWPKIATFLTRVAGREKVQDAMRAEGLLN